MKVQEISLKDVKLYGSSPTTKTKPCMTARGIRDYDAVTRTVCARGISKAVPTGA